MSKSRWLISASLFSASLVAASVQAAVFNVEPLVLPTAGGISDAPEHLHRGKGGLSYQVNSVLVRDSEDDYVVGLVYGTGTNKCRTRDARSKLTSTVIACARALDGSVDSSSKTISGLLDPLETDPGDAVSGYEIENIATDVAETSNGVEVVGYSFDDTANDDNAVLLLTPPVGTPSTTSGVFRTTRGQLGDQLLPPLTRFGNEDNQANAINSNSIIVGWSRYIKAVATSESVTCADGPDQDTYLDDKSNCTTTDYQRAVVYPSALVRLPVGLGVYQSDDYNDVDQYSVALDISDDGTAPVVVGRVGDFSRPEGSGTISWARGFWYRLTDPASPRSGHGPGIATDTDTNSGIVPPLVDNADYDTSLNAINTNGLAVGSSQTASNLIQAISFNTSSPTEAPTGLGYLETSLSSVATTVGNSGLIGGNAVVRKTAISTGTERHGFLWFPSTSTLVDAGFTGRMLDASNLIDCNQGIVITNINKIAGTDADPVIYATAVAKSTAAENLQGKVFAVRLTRDANNDPVTPQAPGQCLQEKSLGGSGGGALGGWLSLGGLLALLARRRRLIK